MRWGRRLGKALDVNTPIPTINGWKIMGDIEVGDKVFDENGKQCNVIWTTDYQYDRECFNVKFSDGSEIVADADHQWTVDTKLSRKWRQRNKKTKYQPITITTKEMIDNLYVEIGSKLEVNYSIDVAGPVQFPESDLFLHPYVLGYWLGDGSSASGVITVGDLDKEEFIRNFNELGYEPYPNKAKFRFTVPKLHNALDNLKILRKYKNYTREDNLVLKHIPQEYMQGSVEQRRELLKGIMDSDGHITKSGTCELTLCNKYLAYDCFELIQSLGHRATIKESDAVLNGKTVGTRFRIVFTPNTPVFKLERKLARQIHIGQKSARTKCRYIVSIEPVESRPVKCIGVDSPSNLFLAGKNFIPTHNSTSMTILMLHKCVTNTNYKVVVVAPMIKHVKVLYDELVKLIENNEYLAANTNRYVASPSPELDFATGSTIRFFTSGVKSGGRSDSTRGQEADLIILDELDYMHPDDLIAILAMLQDTREGQNKKILVGASTPSGAHEVFYDWCTKSKIFKQFYFPSYVNPMWTDEMEEEQRQIYRTANSYKHEIEADWGDNEEGVYPRRYLDVAFNIKNNWEYKDYATNDSDYFIGVDWDKYGAGTNICVLEKYPKNYIDAELANKFRIAYREETPREEFTYLKAVERIIELNRNFNPKYIYVDRGAGEVQVEMLHDAGKRDPFSGLGKKVKGISFKEIIELRNPFTNQLERKETKPFMVDNLYRFFENEMIMIPHADSELYHQLLSYILVRTSQNGNPVFDTINDTPDHAHDALLLACLAFTENYGEFFNVNFNTKARVLSNKFFMPTYTEVAGSKEEKVSSSKAYEPPDEPITTKNKLIARPMSYNVRGSKAPISRRGF